MYKRISIWNKSKLWNRSYNFVFKFIDIDYFLSDVYMFGDLLLEICISYNQCPGPGPGIFKIARPGPGPVKN